MSGVPSVDQFVSARGEAVSESRSSPHVSLSSETSQNVGTPITDRDVRRAVEAIYHEMGIGYVAPEARLEDLMSQCRKMMLMVGRSQREKTDGRIRGVLARLLPILGVPQDPKKGRKTIGELLDMAEAKIAMAARSRPANPVDMVDTGTETMRGSEHFYSAQEAAPQASGAGTPADSIDATVESGLRELMGRTDSMLAKAQAAQESPSVSPRPVPETVFHSMASTVESAAAPSEEDENLFSVSPTSPSSSMRSSAEPSGEVSPCSGGMDAAAASSLKSDRALSPSFTQMHETHPKPSSAGGVVECPKTFDERVFTFEELEKLHVQYNRKYSLYLDGKSRLALSTQRLVELLPDDIQSLPLFKELTALLPSMKDGVSTKTEKENLALTNTLLKGCGKTNPRISALTGKEKRTYNRVLAQVDLLVQQGKDIDALIVCYAEGMRKLMRLYAAELDNTLNTIVVPVVTKAKVDRQHWGVLGTYLSLDALRNLKNAQEAAKEHLFCLRTCADVLQGISGEVPSSVDIMRERQELLTKAQNFCNSIKTLPKTATTDAPDENLPQRVARAITFHLGVINKLYAGVGLSLMPQEEQNQYWWPLMRDAQIELRDRTRGGVLAALHDMKNRLVDLGAAYRNTDGVCLAAELTLENYATVEQELLRQRHQLDHVQPSDEEVGRVVTAILHQG